MEIKEYTPVKNQFVNSRSTETTPVPYSGIRKTKNIEIEKNAPVNFSQNLCFCSLSVRASRLKGIKTMNHKNGYEK